MSQSHEANVVFLIDVRAIRKDSLGNDNVTSQYDVPNESADTFPKSDEKAVSCAEWADIELIKEHVLLLLCKEANTGSDYDFTKVHWCFRFFDSSRHTDFKDSKIFMPFDHDTFSSFEKRLKQRFQSVASTNDDTDSFSNFPENPPVRYLSDSIKIITSDLSWSDHSFPGINLSRSIVGEEALGARNIVYAFFRVPRTDKDMTEFADVKLNCSAREFINALLPQAFSSTFHYKLRIQLNFVDLGATQEILSLPDSDKAQEIVYPRQILKCLQYLNGGRVYVIPFKEFRTLENHSKCLGLIPYPKYLRSRLQQSSLPNENVPSHPYLQSLAQKEKVSPEFDAASSVSRSLRSGNSHLDTSFRNKNKVLGTAGNSGRLGLLDEPLAIDDALAFHRQKMLDMQAHDRMRERERKRKRIDLELDEDEYVDSRRHNAFMDDGYPLGTSMGMDSDSVCEKDQRVQNWIKEGVYKRKKHSDPAPTATVSMSRPALNSSHHLFQQPAPKLPGSRGKQLAQLVASVEQKKLMDSEKQHRRRSSEGLETKRMLQRQEEELSALKHRLKIYLTGGVHSMENDPLGWIKEFKDALKSFSERILADDKPPLVPLAQALVNSASVKFTPPFINRVKEITETRDLTAKTLLERILLTDFKKLNLKLIEANSNEHPRNKNEAKLLKTKKILAFRTAELQIILRVEIAWCFVTPNENNTDDLVDEIVRLLQIISAYRSKTSVENFINSTLLPNYIHGTRFLKELYRKMDLRIPMELSIEGSPISTSKRDDDASLISSTSSMNLYPEDSASNLHVHKPHRRHRPSPHMGRRRPSVVVSNRKTASGSKRVKRQIMVPTTSIPQPSTSQFIDSQRKIGGSTKVSPSSKRVRRNLFDVPKIDKKDSKTLLALSSSKLTKSPAFKSPRGKASPSAFFRAARSRKQLTMTTHPVDPQFGSPKADQEVICPESPATPGMSTTSRYTGANASTPGGQGKLNVIQESPEVSKNEFDNRPMARVGSLSFYSTGSGAAKSKAWERSESKLMAAKIKESVDLRQKDNLGLSDLELLPDSQSPSQKSKDKEHNNLSLSTPGTHLSLCEDSLLGMDNTNLESDADNEKGEMFLSPPPTLASASAALCDLTGPSPSLNNAEISSLITHPKFPNPFTPKKPSPAQNTGRILFENPTGTSSLMEDSTELFVTESKRENSPLPNASSPSSFQTPSKRVQFNLSEVFVNTPVSARRTSSGTPKSILKEAHETRTD